MARADGKEDFSHAEWMTAFAEELASFKDDLAAKGLSHKFVGSRVSIMTLSVSYQHPNPHLPFLSQDHLHWLTILHRRKSGLVSERLHQDEAAVSRPHRR